MNIRMFIRNIIVNIYMRIVNLVFGTNNQVLFVSFNGKSYSDNPRAISEKLHKICPQINIVWAFENVEQKKKIVPNYIKCVPFNNRFKFYKEVAISRVFINNDNFPDIYKASGQMYIQTWHGDRPIKKILYDSSFASCDLYLPESKQSFCDFVVSGSKFMNNVYSSAFRYNGKILCYGSPRNDILVNGVDNKYISTLKNKIGISEDEKIVLYAPTLRRKSAVSGSKQAIQNLSLKEVVSTLEEATEAKWKCLLRAHPRICKLETRELSSDIIDVTSFEDMVELLLIADVLITDYSSCATDYVLLNRPVILFQEDRDEYIENDRTFYFDLDSSPFLIAKNQFELFNLLKKIKNIDVKMNCEQILSFFESNETGEASKKVVEEIINFYKINS